jgi:hypothetical protein
MMVRVLERDAHLTTSRAKFQSKASFVNKKERGDSMVKIIRDDKTILERRNVSGKIELTNAAVRHWENQKDNFIFGYVDFSGLGEADIVSILSSAKRGEARLGKDKGEINCYKLLI